MWFVVQKKGLPTPIVEDIRKGVGFICAQNIGQNSNLNYLTVECMFNGFANFELWVVIDLDQSGNYGNLFLVDIFVRNNSIFTY